MRQGLIRQITEVERHDARSRHAQQRIQTVGAAAGRAEGQALPAEIRRGGGGAIGLTLAHEGALAGPRFDQSRLHQRIDGALHGDGADAEIAHQVAYRGQARAGLGCAGQLAQVLSNAITAVIRFYGKHR
jgi:hypothetical protein